MKQPRWLWFVILFVLSSVIQYFFSVNVYVLLFIVCTSSFVLSECFAQFKYTLSKRENKELQEEIRTTATDAHLKNKQLLTVVSSIPYPMLLIDQFGNVVMHNTIKEICVSDKPYETITYLHNDFVHSVSEFIKDAFILEKNMDKIISVKNIEYQAISVPVTAKGHYSGCLVLFQDISKTLEGEKMQKRFIADASHELKTPIAVLKGMIEILNREDFHDEETQKEFLKQMEVEIERLDILVKDLLQLSRLSLSTLILEREKTDVKKLVEKAFSSLKKKAQDKNIVLTTDLKTDELLFCDPKKILQVLLNLLSNAIKYSDTGTITVRSYTEDAYYFIEVIDEGCGLKKEEIDKIFDRFYRVDDARSRKNGGSGLGLSIVKSIMDAHGGEISVESTYGQGSCFRLRFNN